jgi:hypothetical protein
MSEIDPAVESRFIKLMLSSMLKTIEQLHPDIDAHASMRRHMFGICEGVRQRALESAGDDVTPEQATAQVDALTTMIGEYFDYSASPMFPEVHIVRRDSDWTPE